MKHRQALCRVTRGRHGEPCPGLSSSHKPQFLSVVLKESVESADWAVLLHPRTVGLRLLAGRGEKPGREATTSSASSHLPSFRRPRCRVRGSLYGDTNPSQGLVGRCLQVMPEEVGWREGPWATCWGHAGHCDERWPGEAFSVLVTALRRDLGSGIRSPGPASHLQILHQVI